MKTKNCLRSSYNSQGERCDHYSGLEGLHLSAKHAYYLTMLVKDCICQPNMRII